MDFAWPYPSWYFSLSRIISTTVVFYHPIRTDLARYSQVSTRTAIHRMTSIASVDLHPLPIDTSFEVRGVTNLGLSWHDSARKTRTTQSETRMGRDMTSYPCKRVIRLNRAEKAPKVTYKSQFMPMRQYLLSPWKLRGVTWQYIRLHTCKHIYSNAGHQVHGYPSMAKFCSECKQGRLVCGLLIHVIV